MEESGYSGRLLGFRPYLRAGFTDHASYRAWAGAVGPFESLVIDGSLGLSLMRDCLSSFLPWCGAARRPAVSGTSATRVAGPLRSRNDRSRP